MENYAEIHLGGVAGAGKHARVSAEDYPLLMKYKWHLNKNGYAITKVQGRHKAMHRLLMGTISPYTFVDHIDRDRLNNTRDNLRELTPKENANNMKSNVKIEAFGEEKNISEWVDHSAVRSDAVQATAADQPHWETDAADFGAVKFDNLQNLHRI